MDEYSGKVGKEDCGPSPAQYAFSGRIMLVSVLILFVALIIIAFFHVYTRTVRFLLRSSGVRLRRAHELPPNADIIASSSASTPHGLEPSVLKVLPTFVYSSKTHDSSSLECAVCLSEFEDQETGRILPKCNHCFHVGCIDMWFQSHSNCPLCRAPVQNPDGTVLLVVQVSMPETDPSSGLCPNYQSVQDQMGCSNSSVPIVLSSLVEDRKLPEFTINVDPQPQVTRGDQGTSSPSNPNGGPGV